MDDECAPDEFEDLAEPAKSARPGSAPGQGTQAPERVGYGKPPTATRFKKGQSGNPAGRVRGSKNKPAPLDPLALSAMVLEEAYRLVEISSGDRSERLPVIQLGMRRLGVVAAKGNHKAFELLVRMTKEANTLLDEDKWREFKGAVELKTGGQALLHKQRQMGGEWPELVPHPDDIAVDTLTQTVVYNGPFNEIEQAKWDEAAVHANTLVQKINERLKSLGTLSPAEREEAEREIEADRDAVEQIRAWLPERSVRRRPGFNIHKWREEEAAKLEAFRLLRAHRKKANSTGG